MAVKVELEKVSGLSSAQTPVRVATPVDYTTLYLGQQCLRDCVTLCLLPATVELLSETRTGDRGCKPHSKCSPFLSVVRNGVTASVLGAGRGGDGI